MLIDMADVELPFWVEKWQIFKKKLFTHGRGKCDRCGWRNKEYLTVHHIKPLSKGGYQYDRENIRILCRPCHNRVHNFTPREKNKKSPKYWEEHWDRRLGR